ncbi:CLUMA_CG017867, isoform A [Clunio marinus]|uniref:CLUMA_CG017867, isoform A n=1 Tax=Clunio marinus TaxID=568069 RepID=A0A1J1J074_9DIPT|nr:CLUMA_CG017867, isoform A [Clunio marinus]
MLLIMFLVANVGALGVMRRGSKIKVKRFACIRQKEKSYVMVSSEFFTFRDFFGNPCNQSTACLMILWKTS